MANLPDRNGKRRYFSFEEANRTLPLVRRIVQDIVDRYADLEPMVTRYRRLTLEGRTTPEGQQLKGDIDTAAESLDALIRELHGLGCHFKGFNDGLVDWYSYYAGRIVVLCWKLGEPEIQYWHQIDAGFAGRQLIQPGQHEAFRATAE